MAVSLIGTGGLFTRLGGILAGVNEVNTFVGTTEATRAATVLAQYLAQEQGTVANISNDLISFRTSPSSWLNSLRTYAQNTIVNQVNRDTPLTALTLNAALQVLVSQMATSADTLTRPTVSSTVAAGAGNYGSTVVATTLKDTDGLIKYTPNPDTITITATNDAGRGGTAFGESLSVAALPAVDALAYNWPQGSGASGSLTVVNGANDTTVADGSFEQWTGTTALTKWTIGVGTGGTTIIQSTAALRGSFALRYLGTGAELTSIYQTLTASSLAPNTVYALNYWAKRSTGAIAGVLRVRLTDGSGTTLNDDSGTANALSTTISSGLTTSYAAYNTFFVTPKVLPATYRVYVELTTGITAGESIDIDLMAFVPVTPLYAGGPIFAAFSGLTQAAVKDTFTATVANNGGTTSLLMGAERLLGLRQLGIKLGNAVSGTVGNSLIV